MTTTNETPDMEAEAVFLGRCAHCLDNAHSNSTCASMTADDCIVRRSRATPPKAPIDAGVVEALREALEPFAKEAIGWSPEQNGGHIFVDGERADETNLTVGDFRRAAKALTAAPQSEDKP